MDNAPRSRRSTTVRHEASRQNVSEPGDRHGRPRVDSNTMRSVSPPDQFESRFPRFQQSDNTDTPTSATETTNLISRDFADNHLTSSPSRQRHTEFSLPPPSLRRRVGSGALSVSPGPSQSWRSIYDAKKGTVAIAAASARDPDSMSRKFSMAGPAPMETLIANQNYVDPGYTQLNPAYDQPANVRPVWSLAKPLPHVLRPGMVPEKDELKRMEDKQRALEAEETPEEYADLEAGRIEPSLRIDHFKTQLSQLASVRRDRELHLFDTFQREHQGGTPNYSPYGGPRRRTSTVSELPESGLRHQEAISEEETSEEADRYEHEHDYDQMRQRHEPLEMEFPQLREAIAHVKEVREDEQLAAPYEDAVPLLAYQAEEGEVHNLHTYWSVIRLKFRDPFAEFLAVIVMDLCGLCTNVAYTISRGAWGTGDTANWVWGLGCMMAIYIAGGVSGAQLNPATSFTFYIYRGFPIYKFFIYLPAQFLAIFIASLITFLLFEDGIMEYARVEASTVNSTFYNLTQAIANTTASANTTTTTSNTTVTLLPSQILACFISFPRHTWVTYRTSFLTEMVGTAVLSISVLAIGDDTNAPPGAGMSAFIIGLVVTVCCMAFAYNTGLMMNPIRDLAPRLMLTAMGYGTSASSIDGPTVTNLFSGGYWFTVAWLGPLCGAILGGLMYDAAIFVGGESPVNYPSRRIRRAARKWKMRWKARIGRTRKKVKTGIKKQKVDDDIGSRYGAI